MTLKVRSKFWIVDEQGRPLFGQGRRIILEKIEELGSIKAAAEELKMSYRAVWGKIKATEERMGHPSLWKPPREAAATGAPA